MSSIEGKPDIPNIALPASDKLRDAHVFRSELIDIFSEIEMWIVRKIEKHEPDVAGKKPLGQKLAVIQKLTENDHPIFKNPARVRRLLDLLQPFADLRAELAHSTLTILSTTQKGDIVVYQNANESNHPVVNKRGYLTTGQMKHYLKRTGQICAQLKLLETCK